MGSNAWYPGLVSVVRAVLCWCSAFWLFSITEYRGQPGGVATGPYLLYGLACYGFWCWFLRKPRSIPALVGTGAAWWLIGSVVLLWRFAELQGFAANFIGMVSVCSVVVLSVKVRLQPPVAAGSISALEATSMFFLFFLWVQLMYGLSLLYSAPLLAATLLSLSLVVYQRLASVGEGSGRRQFHSVVIVGVMLAAIAVVLVLFMAFGAEPLGQGALMLYYAARYCLGLVGKLVMLLMQWLAALLPDAEGEMLAEPPAEIIVVEELPEEMQLPPWMLVLLGTAALCIAVAVVAYLLFQVRKIRVGGKRVVRTGPAVQRKKISLWRWLARLLEALRLRWQLTWAQLTMRGSPQELYWYLRRTGRHMDCRQRPGETPCTFVRRAALVVADGAEPELPRALEELAAALGVCLYAPREPAPLAKETVRCIRRSFRKALGRARRRQLRAWFREKLQKDPAA